jgi:AraC-like DNA-binding protein
MITGSSNHVITLKNNYRFQKYLTKIYETFQHNGTIKEASLSNDVSNILTELILDTSISTNSNSHTDVIEDIVAYINDHLDEELTLQQLSSLACLSPYYFNRLFKKEVGMPPHEYVIETRVHAAKFYLKTTSLSIKEIATKLGFHCESSFCTTFKNKVRLTPSVYRNSTDR